jgi:DNA polymerase III psi subunit
MFNIHNMAFLAIVTVLLILTGCTPAVQTTSMTIDSDRYDPAVARYPASVGVYFPDDFFENNFYHETNDGHHHTFHNNPADATRQALVLAFEAIFAEVRYLDTLQEGLDAEDLAFVVVPNISSMTADLAPEVIAVMMVYQFEFFADGEHFYSWQISGQDSVGRLSVQMASTISNSASQQVRSRAISPEKFDAVARRAVWDAISVLMAEFGRQRLLTDRLPASVVNGKAVDISQLTAADQITLAMVGPIFDQGQVPEKQRLETCLIEEINDNGLSLQTVPLHDLRDQLYPWLSRSNYPQQLNELELIVMEPAVRERLQELGVQYILNWDGETTSSQSEGPLYMTPYGIIGYESADKTSVIKADLLAVEDGRVVTSFEILREGTDYTLGLVWFPVPFFEDTEEDACEEITRQIETFIQVNAQHKQDSR